MIRSWMHIVNELSRALSQIDCDTVFTCGTLYDACVRDERKNEMLAAQYATRPEELASTLKSQIGFTISQDIVDMILKEALNSEREEDEEKMEEDEEKMEVDVEEKMDTVSQQEEMDVGENTVREENKMDVVAQEEKIDNVSIITDAKEENLWTCEKCTLKNSMAVLSCVVCGHSKSRDSSSSNRNDAPVTIEPTPKRRSLTEASNASLARSCMESHWSIVFDEETNDALWECEEENMTCLKIARKFSLPILSSLIAKINLKRFPQLTEKSKLRVGTRLLIPWLPISLDRRFRRLGWGRLITTNNALKMKCDGPKKFFWVRRRRRRIHFKYKKHTHARTSNRYSVILRRAESGADFRYPVNHMWTVQTIGIVQ